MQSSAPASDRRSWLGDAHVRPLIVWASISAIFLLYLGWFWLEIRPGVLTDDSGIYLQQLVSGELHDKKPYFFTRFLQLISLDGRVLSRLALVHGVIGALLLARILTIGILSRPPVWLLVPAAVTVLNPYVVVLLLYVQNDALFCLAIMAVITETLWALRQNRVGNGTVALLALAVPAALLFRQNGLLFVPIWLAVLPFMFSRRLALRLMLPALLGCAVGLATMAGVDRSTSSNALFPAVSHVISGLSRAERGVPVGGNLSQETRDLVGETRVQLSPANFDPRYWDFIGFYAGGPLYAQMAPDAQRRLVASFVRNDLWANLPGVIAIRTQLFANLLLGRSHPLNPYEAGRFLPPVVLQSSLERQPSGGVANRVIAALVGSRLAYSAIFGLALLCVFAVRAVWLRDRPQLLVCLLLFVQVAGLFALAPAADARYLFLIYLFPMAALVAWRPFLRADEPAWIDIRGEHA